MRSKMVKGVLVTTAIAGLAAGAFLAFPALAQDMLPDGPGKAETVAACSGCHGLGQIVGEHRDAATWATTVTSMINNGAPVADADFDKVVNYLATYYGTGPAPAAAPAAPGAAIAPAAPLPGAPVAPVPGAPAAPVPGAPVPGASVAPVPGAPAAPAPGAAAAAPLGPAGIPEGPGMAETVAACSGCHGLGQIQGEHRDAATWATTVTSMINNGAPVADADFDKVVNYLATYFGP